MEISTSNIRQRVFESFKKHENENVSAEELLQIISRECKCSIYETFQILYSTEDEYPYGRNDWQE